MKSAAASCKWQLCRNSQRTPVHCTLPLQQYLDRLGSRRCLLLLLLGRPGGRRWGVWHLGLALCLLRALLLARTGGAQAPRRRSPRCLPLRLQGAPL